MVLNVRSINCWLLAWQCSHSQYYVRSICFNDFKKMTRRRALNLCPIPDACLLVMTQRPSRLLGLPETRSLIFLVKNSPDQAKGYLNYLQPLKRIFRTIDIFLSGVLKWSPTCLASRARIYKRCTQNFNILTLTKPLLLLEWRICQRLSLHGHQYDGVLSVVEIIYMLYIVLLDSYDTCEVGSCERDK
jgi:hypothetical protein